MSIDPWDLRNDIDRVEEKLGEVESTIPREADIDERFAALAGRIAELEHREEIAAADVRAFAVFLVADHAAKLLERTGTPLYSKARALRRGALTQIRKAVTSLATDTSLDEEARTSMTQAAELTADLMDLRT